MPTVHDQQPSLRRRVLWLSASLAVMVALAVAWSWSPLRVWLDIDLMVVTLQRLGSAFGPFAAVCGFALAVVAAVPLTFLTLVTLVAFGPWVGFACSLAGALMGAGISYVLGRFLGREVVERLAGERVNLLSRRLANRGVLAIIAVRMVPIAPFAIVNMVAGASHIRMRDLLLGTAIGMTPGTLVMMIFMDQIIAALKQPNSLSLLLIAIPVVLIALGVWGVRCWFRQTQSEVRREVSE